MNEYRTMGDVRIAAREHGMTLDDFFFQTAPEKFEGVDWNDERPSESLDERLERLQFEMSVIVKYGQPLPDRLLTEYYDALEEWCEEFVDDWERTKEAMDNAPIGNVDDYATEKDIQL